MELDAISREYISLAFAIEQHVQGYVDAYVGPPELREAALLQERAEPAQLIERIAALQEQLKLSTYPLQRKGYLAAQLRAMQTTCRLIGGATLSFVDEVERCFDISAQTPPDQLFAEALEELEQLVPGHGSLSERMPAYRQRFEIGHDLARQLIDLIAVEARRRTAELVELPAGEQVEFVLVQDQPWSGYNWYLGQARSRVEINTDLPIRADSLLDLVCHEAYPGHHTEHALKEQLLYVERGMGEATIFLINTPECVISEGIATLAAEAIFDDPPAWRAAQLYPLAGIESDPAIERRIQQAMGALRGVSARAALMLHAEQRDPEEVLRFMMRYTLRPEHEARQSLRFLRTPLWRIYTFTYFAGRDLLGRWIARGDKRERFVTLLTSQVYPAQIEKWFLEEEQQCPG